eukprot:Skav216243  [mRNA]  locus=scaffold20:18896:20062:- [translate_table: standard]
MKKDIPTVLGRVGQTIRPTAIVTSQPASELYMPAAHCKEVFCSIVVQSDSGPTRVTVKRYLIQLGMDPDSVVTMDTEDLDTIQESITMVKVVVRFDSRGGWDPQMLRAVIVSDYLKQNMPDTAFSSIVVREDGSATALVHASKVTDLLKKSGQAHVYCKPHVSVEQWQGLEILWLPASILHTEAVKMAKEDGTVLGLAVKQNQEFTRFGLRFENLEELKTKATSLGLSQEALLGRFKITAVSEASGAAGVLHMMESIAWPIEEVLYIGEGHAIVAAKDCPNKNKYKLMRQDGMAVPIWIHAVNAKARELFKSKNIAFRRADGEGEDVDMEAGNLPEVKDRLKQASEVNTKKKQELLALKKKNREPTFQTPVKETRQKTQTPSEGQGGS